jgi:hypothetical protein
MTPDVKRGFTFAPAASTFLTASETFAISALIEVIRDVFSFKILTFDRISPKLPFEPPDIVPPGEITSPSIETVFVRILLSKATARAISVDEQIIVFP